MKQIKKLLVENLNYIFNILKPYKHQKISTFVEIQLQDFIQLFSRLQLIQNKLQQLFKMCDSFQKSEIWKSFGLIINSQRKQQQSYSKINDERSPELREQILQLPICQEFSFESPLPSLREQEQPQQQFKHVKLEDLLKIEERLISDSLKFFYLKFALIGLLVIQVYKPKQIKFCQEVAYKKNNVDNSFDSQHNIKHLIRRIPNNSIQRDKSPSEHISRSSSSLLVEQSQTTRQQKEVFKEKLVNLHQLLKEMQIYEQLSNLFFKHMSST